MDKTNASADANLSAQGRENQEKEEKKPAKVIMGTVRGVIEDIYDGTTSDGGRYMTVYVSGKKISAFDDRLKMFSIGDFVEIQYKQKGVYLNLISISKIEMNSQRNQQTLLQPQNIEMEGKMQLSASVKFAENLPRISFRDGVSHTVKLLGDEEAEILDVDGNIKKGIRYYVEEDGKKREFFTTSTQLITTLAKFYIGDVVKIQLKHKNVAGRIRSVYEISKIQ